MIAPRTLLVLAALGGTASTAQAAFDVTATGRVEYLRFDDFPNPKQDTTESYQASYSFRTDIPSVLIGTHKVLRSGAATTTISDVKGAEHGSDVTGGGGCTGTTGSAVPGSIETAPLPTLDGTTGVSLRTMASAVVHMTACGGDLEVNDLDIDPWSTNVGESPFDAFLTVSDAELSGDVFSQDFSMAAVPGQCPGEVKPFTTQCSIAVTGTATFTRVEAATPTPTPSPTASPTASPSPAPTTTPPAPPKVRGGFAGGRVVRTTVTCVAGCTGTLTVTLPSGKLIGRTDVDAQPGTPERISVRLSRKARRATVTVRAGGQVAAVKIRR